MPSAVWCEWWPEPTVPVPMARRLVWMPVLPRVTVSAALNFRGSAGRAKARRAKAEAWRERAPAAQAVRWRNSRRFMGPPCWGVSEGTTHKSWTHEAGLGYPARLEHGARNFVVKELYAHARFTIVGAQLFDMCDAAGEAPFLDVVPNHFAGHFQMHLNHQPFRQPVIGGEINAVVADIHGGGFLFRIGSRQHGAKPQGDFHDQTTG